ncbi:hypothetical protein JTB14_018396 [Gonioctena quinquepunctata]|nr:hypothetical protein JTB14_018396 [Gonioctena quinquepunctata]
MCDNPAMKYNKCGIFFQRHDEHDVALTKYKMALHYEPDSVALWNNIGMCFYAKQKYVAAISCLKRALWVQPLNWRILFNLGLAHLATLQPASAFNFACAAVNLRPDVPDCFAVLGEQSKLRVYSIIPELDSHDIIDFLEKDETSRMCPGKRDLFRSGKLLKQKRLLTDNMRNLHKKILNSVTYKISLSTFCRYRPFWVTWANLKERDTCKCVVHANMELIISKLHENKVILHNNIPSLLSDITCDIYCTKCLFRECINCRDKALEYNLSQVTKTVTYRQWMYENSTYEKNGETKIVRKPLKKKRNVTLKKLVLVLEETLKSFLLHAGNIAHQYQMMTQLKKKLSTNEVLIHIDFSENYCCKYWEEIQAVHFGGGRQQVTLHTGVLYLKNPDDTVKAQSFCTLSDNNRHDSIAVWAHLEPIFDWLKNQRPNIHAVHILSDSPVNRYRNKFVYHIVSHHLKYFLPGMNNFTWNYSEPGHGKGAPAQVLVAP